MGYIKILEVFILNVLFNKNEYNIFHKNFKPVKVIAILLLVCNVFFTFYLVDVIIKINKNVHEICPDMFKEDIPNIEPKEILEIEQIEEEIEKKKKQLKK